MLSHITCRLGGRHPPLRSHDLGDSVRLFHLTRGTLPATASRQTRHASVGRQSRPALEKAQERAWRALCEAFCSLRILCARAYYGSPTGTALPSPATSPLGPTWHPPCCRYAPAHGGRHLVTSRHLWLCHAHRGPPPRAPHPRPHSSAFLRMALSCSRGSPARSPRLRP